MAAKYIPICREACCRSRTRVPDRRVCWFHVLASGHRIAVDLFGARKPGPCKPADWEGAVCHPPR